MSLIDTQQSQHSMTSICLSKWGNNPQIFCNIPRNTIYTVKTSIFVYNYLKHILGGPLKFIWVHRKFYAGAEYFC